MFGFFGLRPQTPRKSFEFATDFRAKIQFTGTLFRNFGIFDFPGVFWAKTPQIVFGQFSVKSAYWSRYLSSLFIAVECMTSCNNTIVFNKDSYKLTVHLFSTPNPKLSSYYYQSLLTTLGKKVCFHYLPFAEIWLKTYSNRFGDLR